MTGRTGTVLLGIALLAGCGQRHETTVRRISYRPEPAHAAKAEAQPAEDLGDCPGASIHPRLLKSDDPSSGARAGEERRAALLKAVKARKIEEEALKQAGVDTSEGAADARPSAASREPVDPNSRQVRLGDMVLVAPASWTCERSPVDLVLAAFRLPHAEGDTVDAELTVTALGPRDAVSLRRVQQAAEPEVPEGSFERLAVGDHEIRLVETVGESDANDPFPAPVDSGRYRLLNATIFVGNEAYLVNCSGPDKTVASHGSEIRSFLNSLRAVE